MKNFKKFTHVLLPRIVAIILLLGVGIGQAYESGTMIVTAFKLDSISKNISYIEEIANTTPDGWSTENEEKYHKYIDKRISLINSSNPVIAEFAQANNLQRVGQFILPTLATLLLLYSALMLSISTFHYIRNKMLKQN